MAKQLNIKMTVEADASQAKKALQDLNQSLQQIQDIKNMPSIADESYKAAAKAAKDLQRNLESAVNVDTGKLDLNKFSAGLKKSNTSITELSVKLNSVGKNGQQAFLNLAKSIALADNSALNLGTKVNGLMTSLKNTARWQISSSILHGFMGAISGAYNYAQDLNSSLNNIRIVTGHSVDEMSKFAKQANNAAKALSTTTTEYTDAALIYYQQGLSDEDVKKRTDTTIKLANVSHQSAEEVSSQMTAVWNNFDDGSRSLENYADVITALGAKTAASSSEISEGISKFAAVADTVGLSYDKAAASVATVVAETRQSADVVGTAFKTMFARIEGLSQGKTLEDGVGLNKYSKALKVVGVDILDSNKQLKSMDSILDELGDKWNSIDKSQQVALAQTVAGVRQYTQFISLMDNYDKVQANQDLAENSEGTVEEQAKIYAESWEGARDRVKAALQDVYDSLLDDQFFILMLNGLEKTISFVGNLVDGLGGAYGVISLIGSIFMNMYAKEMPRVFENISQNLSIILGKGEKVKQNMLEEVEASLALNKTSSTVNLRQSSGDSEEMQAKYTATQKAVEMTKKLNASMKHLSETEIEEAQAKIKQIIADGEYLALLGKENDALKKNIKNKEKDIAKDAMATYKSSKNPEVKNEDEDVISGNTYEEAKTKLYEEQKEIIREIALAKAESAKAERENNGTAKAEADNLKLELEKQRKEKLEQIKKLNESEAETREKINGKFKTSAEQAKLMSTETSNISKRTESWNKVLKDININEEKGTKSKKTNKKLIEETTSQMKKYGEHLKQASKEGRAAFGDDLTKDQKEHFDELDKKIEAYNKIVEEAGGDTEKLKEALDLLNGKEGVFEALEQGAKDAKENFEQAKEELVELGMDEEKLDDLGEDFGEVAVNSHAVKDGFEEMSDSVNGGVTHTVKLSEAMTKTASTLMQVSTAMNALKNLGSIWTDDDLSVWDKIVQTMTAMSTIIPVVSSVTEVLTAKKWANTAATGAEEAADASSIPVKYASGAAAWASLGPYVLIVAIAAAVVAAIVGITMALSKQSDQAKKAEDAATSAKELADAYQEVKTKYEELKETISDYQSGEKALNTLIVGTNEWKEALRKTNEQAVQLIKEFNLLKGIDYTIDENGVIHIKDKVLKDKEDQKADETARKEAAEIVSGQRKSEADAEKEDEDFKDKYQNQSFYFEKAVEAFKEDADLAAKSNEEIAKTIMLKADKDPEWVEEHYKEYANNNDEFKKTIEQAKKSVQTSGELETKRSNNYSAAAAALVAEDEYVQGSGNKKELVNASGKIYQKLESKNYDKYYEDLTGEDGAKRQDAQDRYAKQAGLTDKDQFEITKRNQDGSFEYKYKDGDNWVENNKVTGETVAGTLSSEDSQKELTESLKFLDQTITKLNNTGKESDAGLAKFLSNQDFSQSNKAETDAIIAEMGNMSTEDYLGQKFGRDGKTLTNEDAEKFGYESAEKMIEAFNKKKGEIQTAWQDIHITEEQYGLENAGEISRAAAQNIQDSFDKIKLGAEGKKGAKKYIEGLNSMLEDVDPADKTKALEELSTIDWSSYDALDQAKAKLSKFGVTLDTGSEKWKEYAEKMRQATGAMPDFSNLSQNLQKVITLTNDLDFGKTISSEDYETLIEYKEGWAEYFQLQSDGTYKFIGNAEQMRQAALDSFTETKAKLAELKQVQEDFNKVEFKGNDGKTLDVQWGKAAGQINPAELLLNSQDQATKDMLSQWGFDNNKLKETIDLAKQGNADAQAQLNELYKKIDEFKQKNFQAEDEAADNALATTAKTFDELARYKDIISTEAYNTQAEAIKTQMLDAVQSLEDFDKAVSEMQQYGVTPTLEEQSKALVTLAENYKNTTKEVKEYQEAIENIESDENGNVTEESKANVEDKKDKLRASIVAGESADKYGLDADVIESQAKAIKKVNSDLGMTAEQATKVAVANERMNAGVKTLHESFADWKKTLQTAEKTSMDYAQAVADTTDAIKNLLAVSDDWELPDEFLDSAEHLDWLTQAAEGSETAINKIGIACAKSSVDALEFNEAIASAYNALIKDGTIKGDLIDKSDFETAKTAVIEGIDSIQSHLDSLLSGNMSLEDVIDIDSFVSSLNQLALTTGMTVEEMNDTLSSIGVQAKVETVSVPKKVSVPTYDEYTEWKQVGETEVQEQVVDQETGKVKTVAAKKPDYVKRTYTVPGPTYEVNGYEQIAQISTTENPISPEITSSTAPSVTYTGVGGTSNRGSTNRGGGVSTSSTTDDSSSSDDSSSDNDTTSAASHEHEVHRYSNEENAINGLTKQYERLNKAKEKAFGVSKIQAMEKELAKLKELKQASSNYLDAIVGAGNGAKVAEEIANGGSIGSMIASGKIGGTAGADYKSLFSGTSASGKQVEYTAKDSSGNEWLTSTNYSLSDFNSMFGTNVSFSLDSFGNIANKDSILNLIQNLKNGEESAYNSIANPDAASTTEYNKRIAYLEEMKERIEQYGSTMEDLSDHIDDYLDRITEIQEKNAEIITEKMEIGVNLGQKTTQKIDRSLKVLGDNIYKSAEVMQKWFDTNFKEGLEADKREAQGAIENAQDAERRLKLYEKNPYDTEAISPADAAEIFDTAESILDDKIDSIIEKIDYWSAYYGDTLDYWNEKLETVNENIENNIKVLDHLQTVLSLLGQSKNYEKLDVVLRGQEEAAQKNYESREAQAKVAEKAYEKALNGMRGLSGEALEKYRTEILEPAISDYQTKAEAAATALESWITATNARIKNNIDKVFADTEDNLTGVWGSFDALDKAMDRQQSIADEYLTKTNQLYETNKMIRKLSQDIDKTDSQIAKGKLKAFQDEIQLMQEQGKLSKTDLEIAQARYEVLQAELALEEIKNAKTTVRLQRDNEGNFGYVYTADQDKTNDAMQALEDKQNALYNLGLQKEQEYGEKIINLRKEWQAEIEALTEAWQNGDITDKEEFENQLADINAKYKEMELAYLESYITSNNLLNEVGAEGQTESWLNSFDEIIMEHKLFNDESTSAIDEYGQTVKSQAEETTDLIIDKIEELDAQREDFEDRAKVGNHQLEKTVDDVTSAVSDLSKEVTKKGGLADAMSTAISKAQSLSDGFFSQYNSLKQLVNEYSIAADGLNTLYQNTVKQINAQVALNHANKGATSVTWGPNGVSANYSGNNSGSENSDSGGSSSNGTDSPDGSKKTIKQYQSVNGNQHKVIYSDNSSELKNHEMSGYTCTKCGYQKWTIFREWGPDIYIKNKATGAERIIKSGDLYKYGLKSGGYTGTWPSGKTGLYTGSWNGPDVEENGKLAFLHQKELVLNATDTENMLEAVKLIRQISQQIDLQAISQSSGFQTAAAQFLGDREPLQQEITIHAEFPNAKDHNEIEEAFINLANKASQYANRY